MSARVTGQQKDGEILANVKGALLFMFKQGKRQIFPFYGMMMSDTLA